jgi:hypothetical protein
MVQEAGYPIHISPRVGRLSGQAKPNEAKIAPRTVPGTGHVDTQEPIRQPGILIQAR